jgi:hypothetical protein
VAQRLRGLGERLDAPLERLARAVGQLAAVTGTAATVARLQRAGERLLRLRRQLARVDAALGGVPSPAQLVVVASACADQLSSPVQVVALAVTSLRGVAAVTVAHVEELEAAVTQLHELSRRVRELCAALPAQLLRASFDGAAELEQLVDP